MADADSDTRHRLLEAGLRLFADRGYAGTSVQDVIEAAGVTKPVLYYYFESKGGLFQALVDQAVDERLRLMRQAAPPGKRTVEALTDILAALTDFARRQPDLLRLSFAVAFAAPGEMPNGFRMPPKIGESIRFIHELIAAGWESRELNNDFSAGELAEGYFQLIQHSVAVAVLGARVPPPGLPPLPAPSTPHRAIELFLHGAAQKKEAPARAARVTRPLLVAALALLLPLGLHAQALKEKAATDPGVSTNVVPTAPANAMTNGPAATVTNDPAADLTTVTPVAVVEPNLTAVAPVKPVPVIVIVAPPPVAPATGLTAVTVGAAK